MAHVRGSPPQLPAEALVNQSAPLALVAAFERGLHQGRGRWLDARNAVGAWAEEHPGALLALGIGLGLLLGRALRRSSPRRLVPARA